MGSVSAALAPSSSVYTNGHFSSSNNSTSLSVEDGANQLAMVKPSSSAVSLPNYKWRLLIAYDGTRYAGWQFQVSPPTIQCIVEKALVQITKLERDHLHFVGASRTDTGVHAWGQVAHFITPFNYDSLETIHAALNGLLPSDIRVREIAAATPEFHARFSAKSKIYHYKIYNDSIMDPFQRYHVYHSAYKLNTAAMREAAKLFIGKHDFSAFVNVSRNDRVPDPLKRIFRFEVIEMGPLIQLEVEGSGFLYRQVRNMVALLVQIGKEAIPADIVPKILATRDRRELAKYALSAPPHGLCLVSVKYNEEHLRLPSECPATSFGRYHTISKCKIPYY
ncbi:tRNA pseudouridine synthase-like 1-like isoform X2 [Hibiscus syriacus]|uniref:tRNA pseudouridine synthase n=1 Tax=Hibiscus syriacus TaxID=106335 RepID=A0A6A3CQ04_HIBSY|nr:tRNA pseudouridine synthase A 1 [Hibiscus syriacus]KAE8730986.1 tRNA pseudouridine synthase-like 1-like isoform X2 [Hibiscus syriacus]